MATEWERARWRAEQRRRREAEAARAADAQPTPAEAISDLADDARDAAAEHRERATPRGVWRERLRKLGRQVGHAVSSLVRAALPALAILLAACGTPGPVDATGRWQVRAWALEGGPVVTGEARIIERGAFATGELRRPGRPAGWRVDAFRGDDGALGGWAGEASFVGRISGATARGTWTLGEAQGGWSARRLR